MFAAVPALPPRPTIGAAVCCPVRKDTTGCESVARSRDTRGPLQLRTPAFSRSFGELWRLARLCGEQRARSPIVRISRWPRLPPIDPAIAGDTAAAVNAVPATSRSTDLQSARLGTVVRPVVTTSRSNRGTGVSREAVSSPAAERDRELRENVNSRRELSPLTARRSRSARGPTFPLGSRELNKKPADGLQRPSAGRETSGEE